MGRGTNVFADDFFSEDLVCTSDAVELQSEKETLTRESFFNAENIIDAENMLKQYESESIPMLWLFTHKEALSEEDRNNYLDKREWYKSISAGRDYTSEIEEMCTLSSTRFSKIIGRQLAGMLEKEDSYNFSKEEMKSLKEFSDKLRYADVDNIVLSEREKSIEEFMPAFNNIMDNKKADRKQEPTEAIIDNDKFFEGLTIIGKHTKADNVIHSSNRARSIINNLMKIGYSLELTEPKNESRQLAEFYKEQVKNNEKIRVESIL